MELSEIKRQLPIDQVLAHYGLKSDQHDQLLCPFHPDKTPSLHVYPKTNTFCCFSSNCTVGTGDAPATGSPYTEVDELEKAAVLGKVFSYRKRALPLTRNAVDYLAGRCIDYTQHELGYNSGGLHTESKNHHLVGSLVKYGLLKPRPPGGYSVWAKDCILFPLRNAELAIVSLNGRSITNNSDQRHFYLAGREGLYPGYPIVSTTRLILVESII